MGCAISSLEQASSSGLSTNPATPLFSTTNYPATRSVSCRAIDSPQEIIQHDSIMTSSSPDDDVVTMVACPECGHQVPEDNLAIHQAHACGGRARRSSTQEEEGMRQRRRATPASSVNPRPRRDKNTRATQQQQEQQQEQVIDLVDDEVQVVEQNQWSCPRCTLLNPNTEPSCGACQYSKNPSRTPDATRREQLIPQQQQQQQQAPPSPGAYVGGGALLGSVLGAAGAAMRGDSWVGGAFEGAVSGAMGGAVLGSTAAAQQQEQQRRNVSSTRMQQPRSSIRVHRSHSGNHTTTTVYAPDGNVSQQVLAGGDPILGFLMANGMQPQQQQQRQHGGMNVDNMTYEQLLERFGDGTEHRGADEAVISSLPVSRVSHTISENDTADHNKCSICLEQFQKGDKRKTLPCLHGFHDACVDKWLRANASCPICKHVVSS